MSPAIREQLSGDGPIPDDARRRQWNPVWFVRLLFSGSVGWGLGWVAVWASPGLPGYGVRPEVVAQVWSLVGTVTILLALLSMFRSVSRGLQAEVLAGVLLAVAGGVLSWHFLLVGALLLLVFMLLFGDSVLLRVDR